MVDFDQRWLDFVFLATDIELMSKVTAFQTFFASELAQITSALDHALSMPASPSTTLLDAMRYGVMSGGKRIRPLLVVCVAKALGGDCAHALPSATALELLHSYTLIHDDLPCMDNDAVRRGQPTVHVKYGESTALLAGDALLTLAFEQASQAQHAPAEVVRLLAKAAGAQGVIAGQVADLAAVSRTDVTVDELTFIHRNKTAALFRVAAEMGAYAAGKGEDAKLVHKLAQFGESLGLAFQYVDDLLDAQAETAFSSVNILGKDTVQERADHYTKDALETIMSLGAAAESLRMLAQFMLRREA